MDKKRSVIFFFIIERCLFIFEIFLIVKLYVYVFILMFIFLLVKYLVKNVFVFVGRGKFSFFRDDFMLLSFVLVKVFSIILVF